jgi:hypothetical protein
MFAYTDGKQSFHTERERKRDTTILFRSLMMSSELTATDEPAAAVQPQQPGAMLMERFADEIAALSAKLQPGQRIALFGDGPLIIDENGLPVSAEGDAEETESTQTWGEAAALTTWPTSWAYRAMGRHACGDVRRPASLMRRRADLAYRSGEYFSNLCGFTAPRFDYVLREVVMSVRALSVNGRGTIRLT